jgi:5-methylcytosine-specific restriction enzyme subunit McrC
MCGALALSILQSSLVSSRDGQLGLEMDMTDGVSDWAKLILSGMSPLTGAGKNHAPSLLFPMEALFEAYVEKHLRKQVLSGFILKSQANSHYLVEHQKQNWFRLKPDLLVHDTQRKNRLLLDTKWKLIDSKKCNGSDKYQLNQADFYQLFAYGHHYLQGSGDVVLVYPKTDTFAEPLPVFRFPKSDEMRLWVLPFCLQSKRLLIPDSSVITEVLTSRIAKAVNGGSPIHVTDQSSPTVDTGDLPDCESA